MTVIDDNALSEHRQASMPEVPQPGRVVEVRGATWAVADVRRQGLRRSPADETQARVQHVVTLQSLDEDRLGEELSVVWELEVGRGTTWWQPVVRAPDFILQ